MLDIFKHTLGANGWLKAWSIYLIAFPFYFFPAGSAQPSDVFIVVIIGLYILGRNFRLKNNGKEVFNNFLRFCLYLTVVNLGVFISLLGERNSGLPWFVLSAFYFYNLIVMGFALSLYRQYRRAFLFTSVYSCLIAAALQIALSFVLETSSEDIRGAMFFTNPNQLGYYSLCGLAIVLVLESMIKLPKLVVYLSFFLFSYLALVSVSKAALGAMIILFGTYLIANKVFSINNILAVIVVGGIGFFAITKSEFGQRFQKNLEARNLNEADRPDEITEWQYRGYDRISNHPEYLVFGAGKGGYNRFDTFIENHEIHSSFGTIVFCYGIPGTVLFLLFIYSLLKKLPWFYLVYSLPLFAYGVTHMGLRFTIFWVALMMFPIIRAERQRVDQLKMIMSNKKIRERLLLVKQQTISTSKLTQITR
uniref:O-antigen ligase family protein n=2 Tax=Roseivirga sp. TaxID=1964215 RepID=UPI004047A637